VPALKTGLSGDSMSKNVSRGGEGVPDEHNEVAVVPSPSEFRDPRVEALENRDVSFNGSSLRRSGDNVKLLEFVAELLAELILLDRTLVVLAGVTAKFGSIGDTGVTADPSPMEDTADSAREVRFDSFGIGEGVLLDMTGDTLSLRLSLNRSGSRCTRNL